MNRTRRTLAAVAVVGALLSMIAGFGQALPSGAAAKTGGRPRAVGQAANPFASPFVTVSADKTTNVHDGDTIHITVTPRPGVTIDPTTAELDIIEECAQSATATVADAVDRTKCPGAQQSSSMPQLDGKFYWLPDGSKAVGSMVVGVGTAQDPNHKNVSVTCDPTHPCRLVLQGDAKINGQTSVPLVDASTLLHFASQTTNTAAGCNGLAPGTIASAGPDRLGEVWARWQSAECAAGKTPGKAESTTVSFPTGGEAKALDFFSTGVLDLAYSAVGPDTPGFTPSKSRPSVAIPIALDASGLAIAGGHATDPSHPLAGVPIGLPQPFNNINVTMGEFAELIARGALFSTSLPAMVARNPTLGTPLGTVDQSQGQPFSPVGPNSISLFASSAFLARTPAQWRTSNFNGNKPRGIVTDFANATPDFAPAESQGYSSRQVLAKPVFNAVNTPFSNTTVHEAWIFTDLATANFFDVPMVHLQTGKGDFVPPTPASIQAAVSTMETAKDGMLRPNPAASADHAGAYPLSFVEYAIAPAQPLVNGTCTLRTNSQTLLNNWLTYITTEGQSNLADGLVPLTPALRKQAADAIAKVGKAPTTGACKGKVKAPNGKLIGGPNGNGAGGAGGGGAGAFGTGAAGAGSGSSLNGSPTDNSALDGSNPNGSNPAGVSSNKLGGGPTRASTAATRRQAAQAAQQASIKMPGFLGASPISALIPPVSLLLITLITYIAGMGTSGRPVWPQFRRRRREIGTPRLGLLRRLRPAQ